MNEWTNNTLLSINTLNVILEWDSLLTQLLKEIGKLRPVGGSPTQQVLIALAKLKEASSYSLRWF